MSDESTKEQEKQEEFMRVNAAARASRKELLRVMKEAGITVTEVPYDPNEPTTVWVPNQKPSWAGKKS